MGLIHSQQSVLLLRSRKFSGYKFIMANADPLADLMAQIATEVAALSKLWKMKQMLQNEVVAKQEELQRLHGVKRKQEKHTQPKKKQTTGQKTNTHGACVSNNMYHGTNGESTSISTRDNVCMKPLLMHQNEICCHQM